MLSKGSIGIRDLPYDSHSKLKRPKAERPYLFREAPVGSRNREPFHHLPQQQYASSIERCSIYHLYSTVIFLKLTVYLHYHKEIQMNIFIGIKVTNLDLHRRHKTYKILKVMKQVIFYNSINIYLLFSHRKFVTFIFNYMVIMFTFVFIVKYF